MNAQLTKLRGTYCAIALLLLGACQQAPSLPIPTLMPYKIDIQQGNVVTQEMVEKLKPGMTPSQVRFILGTPLVVDAFHKDRWDYVYRFSKGGTLQESRRIVVVFKDDKLDRIEGDVVAAQPGGGVSMDKPAPGPAKPGLKPAPPQAQPETASSKADVTSAGSGGTAASGTAGATPGADTASVKAENKPAEEKPKEERGFFGRMLDKLGF